MANLDTLKIYTFARITRTEVAYAAHKLQQHEGDLNAAIDGHYRFADTNIEQTTEIEKQLREVARTIWETISGVSEAPNVEHLRQMKSSSSSVDEENKSRGVPALLDEWLALYEAAMNAQIPDSRYQSGSLAPCTPSPSANAQSLIRDKQAEEYYESLQADREKVIREAEACQLEIQAARNAKRRKIEEEQELEKQLAEKEASLSLEPAIDEENAVTILIRMPSGNRLTRCLMKPPYPQSSDAFPLH